MSNVSKEVSPIDYHSRLKVNRANLFDDNSFLSKSVIWPLKNQSLYEWRYHPKPFAGSDAADWGSLLDCLVTTPDLIDDIAVVHDHASFRTNDAKDERDEAKAQGKIFVKRDVMNQVEIAAGKLMSHKVAGPIITESKKQVILLGKSNGMNIKALMDLDLEGSECLYDIKTTGRWSPKDLSKTIATLGYHVQAGIYQHLWNQSFPDDLKRRFRLIWQQQEPPYEVTITELPASDIEAGINWAAHQIERLARAAKSDYWPGIFEGETVMLGRPDYANYDDAEETEPVNKAPASR